MERDTGLRRWLALFLILQSGWVAASSLPVSGRQVDVDSRASQSSWTTQLGAVDRYGLTREERVAEVPAAWDGAVATYNMISAPRASKDPSVFVLQAEPAHSRGAVASVIAENVRAGAVPAPAALWLLVAGLIGVVGIARRRGIVARPARRARDSSERPEAVSASF